MASSSSFTTSSKGAARSFSSASCSMRRCQSASALTRLTGHFPSTSHRTSLSGISKASLDTPCHSSRTSLCGVAAGKEQLASTAQFLDSTSASTAAVTASTSSTSHTSYASLSRLLLIGQPSSIFRIMGRVPRAGPISFLLFLFGIVAAFAAYIRSLLIKKAKSCSCCKGYGIVRCTLCQGKGTVGWSAKFSYNDGCPMCMTKRFVECPDCGGFNRKGLFFGRASKPSDLPKPQFSKPPIQGLEGL